MGRSRFAPLVFGCQAPDSGNAEILAHFNLNDAGLSDEGKLNALAVMFHQATKENVK